MIHLALFAFLDVAAAFGLWESNGTASGTFPIGGLKNAGVANATLSVSPL